MNIGYFTKTDIDLKLDLRFESFLKNWSANYNYYDLNNLQILMDFEGDVEDGFYTKTKSNGTYVHYAFTEQAKDFIRFKELL